MKHNSIVTLTYFDLKVALRQRAWQSFVVVTWCQTPIFELQITKMDFVVKQINYQPPSSFLKKVSDCFQETTFGIKNHQKNWGIFIIKVGI